MGSDEAFDRYPTPAPTLEQAVVFPKLSKREREVALLLVVGKTNGEIAQALDVSVKTIDTHRGNILKKLGLRNNVELTLFAIRNCYTRV